jgi:hypothetical protein
MVFIDAIYPAWRRNGGGAVEARPTPDAVEEEHRDAKEATSNVPQEKQKTNKVTLPGRAVGHRPVRAAVLREGQGAVLDLLHDGHREGLRVINTVAVHGEAVVRDLLDARVVLAAVGA